MNFAAWKVRTLHDRDNSDRSQRRTALTAGELARYNIDIAVLSEAIPSFVVDMDLRRDEKLELDLQ